NSTLGAAVRFFIKQRNAQLALPEVVRLEVERNFRKNLKECVGKVRKNHRQLLAVFGKLKEVVLPNDAAIESKIAEIFSGVGGELLQVDFSFESARSSFLKTVEGLPPSSDQNQQFKDGVLWSDCIRLLEQDDVFFVTSDSAFFHKRNYEEGLAKNLLAETIGKAHQLKTFRSLGDLLTGIKTEVVIDEALLVESFMNQHGQLVDDMLGRNSFSLEKAPDLKKTLYATELPTVLYIEFAIDFPCSDLSDQGRTEAVFHLNGTGSYDVESGKYDESRFTGQELDFLLADGTTSQSANIIIGAASIVIGHRDVIHSVRYQLTEENR
ncbi:MAG: DUF4935 domain-containing protein, partial [Lentisphaerae bacterium]|nr:DUF4935 domain-containing protein [Lentisphaerota bacterium]